MEWKNVFWGKFFNLFRDKDVLVKEIVVNPNQGMSFQSCILAVVSEIWFISKGSMKRNYIAIILLIKQKN